MSDSTISSAPLATLTGAENIPLSQAGAKGRTTPDALKAWARSGLTSADVGLANVNNTSDVDKPVSTAQAAADAAALASANSAASGALAAHVAAADPHTQYVLESALTASVLTTPLTGFALSSSTPVTALDTILSALQSLQQQINDIVSPPAAPAQLWYDFTDAEHSITLGLI